MQYSVVNFSNIVNDCPIFRIDSEYFKNEFIELNNILTNKKHIILKDISRATDGEHGSVEFREEGIKYLTAEHIKNGYVDISNIRYIDKETDKRNARASVKPGDVLVSIKGTLGQVALAEKWLLPANMNRDVAIIKINTQEIDGAYLTVFLLSKYGLFQSKRAGSGGVQQMITLDNLRLFKIPILNIQNLIKELYLKSLSYKAMSKDLYQQAEALLLQELNLHNWKPAHQLSYVKNFSDTGEAGRIDAEYFQPKYDEIIGAVKGYAGGWDTLGNHFKQNKKTFLINPDESYNYVEIGSINVSNGEITPLVLEGKELPANAKIKLNKNDVLISKVRTYRGAVAIVESNDFVGSGAFTVLKESGKINKETLVAFFKSSPILDLTLKYNTGTSYPTLFDSDILNIPVPIFKDEIQNEVKTKIQESFKCREQSKQLLEIAKQGVEKAIEENEEAATGWINEQLEKIGVIL